ncbi:MAG TPA: anti-sigma factor [Solibacterales bacterium]|nr:anti-sigma factor [Bryobacterales bacterium]
MLTCRDFLNGLNDFLDETADPESRKHLEQHVNECPNCWVVYDTTKKTIQVYKGMEAQTLPENLHSRLMRALERKAARRGATGASPQQQA